MFSTKFALEGFEVLEALEGEKGLRLARENLPELIILDLILPDGDGLKILETLKKDKKTKKIPVLVLTNKGEKEAIKKALDLGAADYLIKIHFSPKEIVEKVKNLIK
jgi:DNA-binding response OmpR family regulator